MPAIITVPTSLDDQSFEQVLAQVAQYPHDEPLTIDARHCTFATAYGLPALLALAETRAPKPLFLPPEDSDTVRYWEARNRRTPSRVDRFLSLSDDRNKVVE